MASILRASVSATIDRDINDVFAFVSDLTTMDDWVVGVSNTRLVAGERGTVDAVYEFGMEHRGETVPMQVAITAISKPDRIAMRSVEGPFPYESEMTFVQTPAGETRVVNSIRPGADGRFTRLMFTVFKPVLRWMMRRRLRAELEHLTAVLESDDRDQGGIIDDTPEMLVEP